MERAGGNRMDFRVVRSRWRDRIFSAQTCFAACGMLRIGGGAVGDLLDCVYARLVAAACPGAWRQSLRHRNYRRLYAVLLIEKIVRR